MSKKRASTKVPSTDGREQGNQMPDITFLPIIVIGASAGGLEALKKLIGELPRDFKAPLFIVWHMSPEVKGMLPQVLNQVNQLHAEHASEGELIVANRIYVAPPDRHLLIERGYVRVTKGPKEHRFRPAVDPLFRSAAYTYGSNVIGIILSGALNDGTSGLSTIKQYGGTAIVQDPLDAEVPSMPHSAMREVSVDHCASVSEIARILVRLCKEPPQQKRESVMEKDKKTAIEIRAAAEDRAFESGIMKIGERSPYTCPECHGVLSSVRDGNIVRYRCHTGHAYSADSLLVALTEKIEDSIYNAIRGIEENIMLLNHIGDHYAELNETKKAALHFKKAQEAERRVRFLREMVTAHDETGINPSFEQGEK